EAALVAIQGGRIVAAGEAARELLNTPADADLAPSARDRFIAKAKEDLPSLLDGPLAEFVRSRAEELMQDHARLRAAAGSASRVTVEAVMPPDVIGLFVLMPSEV
ncbi:MAG: helicase, partial [Alphaproteobacteria bacterium HGW-Alphaproteobacteria-11]